MLAGVGVNPKRASWRRPSTEPSWRTATCNSSSRAGARRRSTQTRRSSAPCTSAIPAGNASRHRVAAVDALLKEARNSTSEVVRAADYLDVIETVLTDLPVITLYYPQVTVASGAALTLHGSAPAWFLIDLARTTLAD